MIIETPHQYARRILSNLEGKNPISVLKSTPQTIKKLIKGKSRQRLYTRAAKKQWSVAEIVAHLAETEIVLAWRYRLIAEKSGVTLQPFDQDVWAKQSRYGSTNIREMTELFSLARKANLVFLSGLPKQLWNNYGMHQERGKETIRHIVNLEAGHDINHLKQIKKILNRP